MSFLANDREMQDMLGLPAQHTPSTQGDVLRPSVDGGKDLAMVGGAYEAASRFDRDVAMWKTPSRSADDDIIPQKAILDSRVRDSVRNDAFSAAGAEIRKDNIVGAMYLLNSKPNAKVLGLDEKWAEEFQEEVESKFTLWGESSRNYPDASGINNFTSFIRLGVGISGLTGEILGVGDWIKDGRPFSTAVQMIDVDRLSTPITLANRPNIRGGIERDFRGAPVAYHIRKAHPSSFLENGAYEWVRIPVRKPWGRQQVIHIFEQFRPDQSRGIARMVAGLKESRITKKFRDIVLQNAVTNASYAASIESDLPTEAVYQMLGGGNMGANGVAQAFENYAGGYMSVIDKFSEGASNLRIDGVKIPHLLPGMKLQLRPAGKGGPLGTEFEQSLLRYLAAMLGVSYEQLSKDYSRTNYSSARAAMNETYKTMQASKRATADRFATAIFHLWLEEAFAKGEITSLPRNAPNYWDGLNREAYGQCTWIGASRGQIDELKETQAAVLRLKYGLSTREDELGRLGKDWRQTFAQLEREEKVAKVRGLVFAEDDNTMNATTGAVRESEAKDEKDDGSEDNTDA
ncbi:phage portal protein [Ochrobactrum sp. GPK 3]